MLKCLERFSEAYNEYIWSPKVTGIQEAKDINTLSLDALIGFLKTHEIKLIKAHENMSKKGKMWH